MREVLKLALEAFEEIAWSNSTDWQRDRAKVAITTIKEALAQPEQDCDYCGGTGDVSGEYPGVACPECNGSGVRVQPEFIKHEVENAEDWSEWVCPNPQSYLMKCCDCGLVHEAQFRVAKYQPEPSEDFVVADDPDLQAQFRMRRNEQWSPKDTAYRPGGLAQPEQEPVAWKETDEVECPVCNDKGFPWPKCGHITYLERTPPQRTWVGLTPQERDEINQQVYGAVPHHVAFHAAIEAKLKELNT